MHQSKIAESRFRLHLPVRAVLAGLLAASGGAWVAQAVAAATFSFQEGISGYAGTVDTYLSEGLPAKVRGAEQMLWLDTANPNGSGNSETVLIRFDGIFDTQGGPIPLGSQITSATLTYTISDPGFPRRSNIYELLVDWSESVTYQDFAGDGIPGVQPAEYGSFVSKVPVPVGTSTINVTDSLTSWSADPSSNKGWVVLPDNTDLVRLWSSEATDSNLRPILTVIIDEGPPTGELVRHPYLQLGTPTSMSIVWETDLPSDSMVHYGLSPSSLDLWALQASPDTQHLITLTGLSPETKYYYDVGTATRVLAGGDADHYFVTSPPVGASTPSRVWIVGDSGTGGTSQAQVRDAMLAETGAEAPNLFLHLGDMAYPTGTDQQLTDHFFAPYRAILRNTVVWPTGGAHESVSSDVLAETGPYFESYVLPTAGEAGGVASGREAYYSFDFANVHFVSLHYGFTYAGSPMWDWVMAPTQTCSPRNFMGESQSRSWLRSWMVSRAFW